MLIVSLEKWSLTFKIIPGIPPRLVLILLVLVCRIQSNNHKVMVTDISSISHQSYICRDIYAVHPKNYENKHTTTQCTKLDCRHFGLSMFWSVDVLASRRFALSTFCFVNILVCRRFGLSMFQHVDVSVCQHFAGLSTFWFVDVLTSYLQKGPLKHIKAWLVTKMVIILHTTYPNGFLQLIFFYDFAIQEFYFLNKIYILLYTGLISSIFFQYSNMVTQASHHWCLASNIVLVFILRWPPACLTQSVSWMPMIRWHMESPGIVFVKSSFIMWRVKFNENQAYFNPMSTASVL